MIRDACEADMPAILAMGERFFEAAGWPAVAAWDAESVTRTLRHLIADPGGILLVAEHDGELVGMTGALIHPFYFNAAHKTGQELFWWVEPAHRRGVGAALLAALETAARARGAESFTVGAVATLRADAVERLYRARGYRPSERCFIRRL